MEGPLKAVSLLSTWEIDDYNLPSLNSTQPATIAFIAMQTSIVMNLFCMQRILVATTLFIPLAVERGGGGVQRGQVAPSTLAKFNISPVWRCMERNGLKIALALPPS